MHDIAAISDFSTLAYHPERGAEMASQLLKDYPISLQKKDKILHCIRTHSKPIAAGSDIPEAVCISNADAMSQITEPLFWTFYIFGVRHFSFEEGRNWYEQRIADNWNGLIEPAQKMIDDRYKQTSQVFRF